MGKFLALFTHKRVAILLALLLVINIVWTTLNIRQRSNDDTATSAFMANAEKYPLLSRRIFVDNPNDPIINFVSLRKSLNEEMSKIDAQKSFYFEYLPSGTTIKIGSDNELIAASLIKVPLVMNLYRAAELGRIDLDQTVTVQTADLDDAYGDLWKKGAGHKLTLRQAAAIILENSDNTATHVVFSKLRGVLKEDEQSLNQLDVQQNLQNGQAVIDSKSYSSVIRSLYLSSYLTEEHSQEILGYLTKSEENRRLTRFLPDDVTVAHKNGVFNSKWSESDCGIVYVPKRPYILCIMLGLPEDQSNALIAKLSKEIYDYVSTQP